MWVKFGNTGVGIGQFIVFANYLDSFYISKFMFQCWKGIWIKVGTHQMFTKEMAADLSKSSFRHRETLHTNRAHFIIGIQTCHQKLVSISPRASTAIDRLPRGDWPHNFLMTGLKFLNNKLNGVRSQRRLTNIPAMETIICVYLSSTLYP